MNSKQQRPFVIIELKKRIAEQKINDVRCKEMHKILRKADNRALYRRMHLESSEEEIYMNIQRAKEAQARQKAEFEQEQKLAQIMADLKRQEMVELKSNQLLHNNSHELRCFEKQLRTAYANKELLCQIKEKELLKKEEKVREYNDDLKMIEAEKIGEEVEAKLQARKNELNLEYKKAVAEQIRENAENQRDLPPDRPMDFEFTRNSHEQKNKIKTDCIREELNELIKIKNELKENERKESDNTNRCIENYLTNVAIRNKQQEEIKKKKNEEKNKIYACLFDNIVSLTSNTAEKNEMRTMLVQEQQLHDLQLAEKRNKELKKLRQNVIVKENEIQLKIKEDKKKEEIEKDFTEARKLLRNFQVFNEAEEKKNNNRRQKMLEYGQELKKIIDQKNDIRQKEKTLKMKEFSDTIESEKLRMKDIEEEQKAIIGKHIGNVEGFFPPNSNDLCNNICSLKSDKK